MMRMFFGLIPFALVLLFATSCNNGDNPQQDNDSIGITDTNDQIDTDSTIDGDVDGQDGISDTQTDADIIPECGNGIKEEGEACEVEEEIECSDIPGESYPEGKYTICKEDCSGWRDTLCGTCGNGVKDTDETCDTGAEIDCSMIPGHTYKPGDMTSCNHTCSGWNDDTDCALTTCGNGSVDTGEKCEPGTKVDCSMIPGKSYVSGTNATCNALCNGWNDEIVCSLCGNNIVDEGEECDDGNSSENDDCKNDCTQNVCGDGVIRTGAEECDDENSTNEDACKNDCTANYCGDGVIYIGEERCDDGNSIDDDECKNDCTQVASWKSISLGLAHTCGIQQNGILYCWGYNTNGQIGDGTVGTESSDNKLIPIKIGDATWSYLEVGDEHSCGIQSDNFLYCWGSNGQEQLGISGNMKLAPTKIGDATWSRIAGGKAHTCGIQTNNKLYCWGNNYSGQLGGGSGITSPVNEDFWSAIAAGDSHTCGIKTDQTLYCWGWNRFGQLGDGTICSESPFTCADKSVPTKIGDDAWLTITTGYYHTCGIKTDNKLYCWGADRTSAESNIIPTKIGDDTWSAITAGSVHTCGIKTDGKLYCWGDNGYGRLGDGTTDSKTSPTKIGDDTWSFISAGHQHTCGIKTDNKLYCWGWGAYGQLGNGSESYKTTPTLVE